MQFFILAAIGGAIGAVARYGVGLWAARAFGTNFPLGTLIVNVLGGFLMGCLAGAVGPERREVMVLLGVGVLGGFTTFSAFSIETVRLMESGAAGQALAYVALSILAPVCACFAGLVLFRGLA